MTLIPDIIYNFPRDVYFQLIVDEFVMTPLDTNNAALASKTCSFSQKLGDMVDVRALDLQK